MSKITKTYHFRRRNCRQRHGKCCSSNLETNDEIICAKSNQTQCAMMKKLHMSIGTASTILNHFHQQSSCKAYRVTCVDVQHSHRKHFTHHTSQRRFNAIVIASSSLMISNMRKKPRITTKAKTNASTIKIAAKRRTEAVDTASKEKKEESRVKQTQTICTNDRNSLVSHNHHYIAPQSKRNKAWYECRNISHYATKCITSSSSFNGNHHYQRHLNDHNCNKNRLNHAAISFQGKVEVQSQYE